MQDPLCVVIMDSASEHCSDVSYPVFTFVSKPQKPEKHTEDKEQKAFLLGGKDSPQTIPAV